ncbi:MAG: fatty acid desaturase, partial [Sulfobacillus sp.]
QIAAAIWVAVHYHEVALSVAAILFIGSRQQALYHLTHEATHYHLFRQRWLNDWGAEILLAWPCLHSLRVYRIRHFGHHRNIGTVDDPHINETYKGGAEWRFPMSRLQLARILTWTLLGGTFPGYLRSFFKSFKAYRPGGWPLTARCLYYVLAAMTISLFHLWAIVALYWLLPLATWTSAIRRFR